MALTACWRGQEVLQRPGMPEFLLNQRVPAFYDARLAKFNLIKVPFRLMTLTEMIRDVALDYRVWCIIRAAELLRMCFASFKALSGKDRSTFLLRQQWQWRAKLAE